MTPWKFTDASRTVVARTLEDGASESCLAELLEAGTEILEPDPPPPPPPPPLEAVTDSAHRAQLAAFKAMTPDQVGAWVDKNVVDLPTAIAAIRNLAVALSVVDRRLP